MNSVPALLLLSLPLFSACATDPALDTGDSWAPAADVRELLERVLDGVVKEQDRPHLEDLVEDLRSQDGPWWHSIYRAESDDGLTWEDLGGPVWEQGSVAEVFTDSDGTLYMLLVDGDLDRFVERAMANDSVFQDRGLVGIGGLTMLESRDGGQSFTETNDLLITGNPGGYLVDPDVVALPGGGYQLLYFGVSLPDMPDDAVDPFMASVHRAYLARSQDDLATWEHWSVALDDASFVDPCHMLQEDGTWRMFWSGIHQAISSDGIVYERQQEDLPIDGGAPDLVQTGEDLRMYFSGWSGGVFLAQFEGDDDWSISQQPVVQEGGFPSVVQMPDGSWQMFYQLSSWTNQ